MKYSFTKEDTLSVKAIAVILMVMHHMFSFQDRLIDGNHYDSLFSVRDNLPVELVLGNFGKLCVALFMVLSGYGVYKSYMNHRQPVENEAMSAMIFKRIKSIYIKYWQIMIIFFPIGIMLDSEKIQPRFFEWIKNLLALETTFNDETWFVTLYVIIMCMFPFIVRWFNRKYSNPWSDMVWMIVINILTVTVVQQFVGTNEYMVSLNGSYFYQKAVTMFAMLPMFMIGCMMAKYNLIERFHDYFSYRYVSRITGIIIIVLVYTLRERWQMKVSWGWDRLDFIYAALFTIGVAMVLDGLTYVKKVLAFIGKYATGIWLMHSFFCYYYFQDFTYAMRNSVLCFILVLGITLLISWATDKIYHLLWKLIKPLFIKEEAVDGK